MFFQVTCLAAFIILQFANGVPLQDKSIEPVDLASTCAVIASENKDPGKSAVILIHGLGQSYDTWDSTLPVLAFETKRKICAVDLRNHYRSPWNNEEYDVDTMIVDIEHFADMKNFEKVNLIGHSIGGRIAMKLALKNPNRVQSLIVEDQKTVNNPQGNTDMQVLFLKNMKEAIDLVPGGTSDDDAKDMVADYVNKKFKEIGVTDFILTKNDTRDYNMFRCDEIKCQFLVNMDVLIKATKDMDAYTGETKGLYEGPTLFIYGKESHPTVDNDKENIMRLFPNAKLFGVEGAGHGIHGKFPEFDKQVIRFLNALDN